jgi:hypothetical protein
MAINPPGKNKIYVPLTILNGERGSIPSPLVERPRTMALEENKSPPRCWEELKKSSDGGNDH